MSRLAGTLAAAIFALLLCAGIASPASAQSFDCTNAHSLVESTICGDENLQARDEAVAYLYGLHRRSGDREAALASQRAWLAQRNRCGTVACLQSRYDERIQALRTADPGFVYGRFAAENGSLDMIQVAPDRVKFFLLALWRNPNGAHTGELSGLMSYTPGRMEFSDSSQDCDLRLSRERRNWLLIQDGFCGFGLNVSADGTYEPSSGSPDLAPF